MSFYTCAVTRGGQVLYRGVDDEGKRFKERVDLKPFLFIPAADGSYKSVDGTPVERMDFPSPKEARDWVESYGKASNARVFGYHKPLYPYLFERHPGKIEYDPKKVVVACTDIEVASDKGVPDVVEAAYEITAITVDLGDYSVNGKSIFAFGCGDFTTDDPKVKYEKSPNELDMLGKFLDFWEAIEPDVMTGWFIENFDVPYIVNRIKRVMGEHSAKRLSPWKTLIEKTIWDKGRKRTIEAPLGIVILDYMMLYKKFRLQPRERYSLDFIGNYEVGAKKLDYSEYESLQHLYRENFQLFMEYNIRDCAVVWLIDAKLRYIQLVMTMAYLAKCNYEDVFGTVRPWEVLIHTHLLEQKIVVPYYIRADGGDSDDLDSIAGGYVKEPVPGMYKYVVSVDFDSLYPHVIMGYNISPETKIGKIPWNIEDVVSKKDMTSALSVPLQKNATVTGNGVMYRRDKLGFFPILMDKIYSDRVVAKDEMKALEKKKDPSLSNLIAALNAIQHALKIFMNSGYGAMVNRYFMWFDSDNGEAVTLSGQTATKYVEMRVNDKLNSVLKTEGVDYVIAADTDSLYINFGPFIEKMAGDAPNEKIIDALDQYCKKVLVPFIDECCAELSKRTNAVSQRLHMKRENIASKGIWLAKKKYALWVWDSEGVRYDKPELKATGIEIVKASSPECCRKKLKEAITVVFEGDQEKLYRLISDFKAEFKTLGFEDIAFPRSVNGIRKYSTSNNELWVKGAQVHLRGAILYNHLVKNISDSSIPLIYDGDRIKYCHLQEPNPARSDVVSALRGLPKEWGLEQYLDHETQFQKAFIQPLELILKPIGWRAVKRAGLFGRK